MFCAVLGDFFGSRFRNFPPESGNKDNSLDSPDCAFSYHTLMILAVAAALTEDSGNLPGDAVRHMRAFGQKFPDVGYDEPLSRWLFAEDPIAYGGQEAAVWMSSCGIAAKSEDEADRFARTIAADGLLIDDPQTLEACGFVARAVYRLQAGESKEDFLGWTQQTSFFQSSPIAAKFFSDDDDMDDFADDDTADDDAESEESFESIWKNLFGSLPEDADLEEDDDDDEEDECDDVLFSDLPNHGDYLATIIFGALFSFMDARDWHEAMRNALQFGNEAGVAASLAGAFAEAYYNPDYDDVPPHKLFRARIGVGELWDIAAAFHATCRTKRPKYAILTKQAEKTPDFDALRADFLYILRNHAVHPFQTIPFTKRLQDAGIAFNTASLSTLPVHRFDTDTVLACLMGFLFLDSITDGYVEETADFRRSIVFLLSRLLEIDNTAPPPLPVSIKSLRLVLRRGLLNETFDLTRETLKITREHLLRRKTTFRADFGGLESTWIRHSMEILEDALADINTWRTPPDFDMPVTCKLTAKTAAGKSIRYTGEYSRAFFPEEIWLKWMREIKSTLHVIGGDVLSLVLDKDTFCHAARPGEIKILSVQVDQDNQVLYRTKFFDLDVGDRVVLPDRDAPGIVAETLYAFWDQTPIPVSQLKEAEPLPANDEDDEDDADDED